MKPNSMLDKVLSMKGVSFEWNDTVTGLKRDDGVRYGFIAQDLEKVWPENIQVDPHGFLATSYGTYDAMFVEFIKALHNEMQELKKENAHLKAEKETEVSELKSRLDQLEKMIMNTNNNSVQVSR